MLASMTVPVASDTQGPMMLPRTVTPVGDEHRRDHHRVDKVALAAMTLFEQIAVGLQQGLRLAAVEPGVDLRRAEAFAVPDHAHENRRQVKFALDRVAGLDRPSQILHEAAGILEVVETDLGQA